jgi:large subunit ribosomal protein L18
MISKSNANKLRVRRHIRVREKISGTQERPRLNVYRGLNNIYAQIIDDTKGVTIVSASSLDEAIKSSVKYGGNKEAAQAVGALIAKRAIEKGIKSVVFDRGGYLFNGRVKELAEAARSNGLEF